MKRTCFTQTEVAVRSPIRSRLMERIRPFTADDIPDVGRLHQSAFDTDQRFTPEAYARYLTETFLEGPRREPGIESLVYEKNGRVVGFIGVLTLRAVVGRRPIRIAVCSQFCVDPKHRGTTGIRLVTRALAGAQDISIGDEANDATRRILRRLGGDSVIGCSLNWIRPLRPGRLALSWARSRFGALGAAGASFAVLGDPIAARLPQSHVRMPPPHTRSEALDEARMIEYLPLVTRGRALVPDYERASLAWCLRRAAEACHRGVLRKTLVRHDDGRVLGWYLYYENRGGTGEVLQVAAAPKDAIPVLDHLFHDAWRRGVVALRGRADPPALDAYSDRLCLLSCRGPWMVVHARDPSLLVPFHRGEIFFSRLEGEWCARMA